MTISVYQHSNPYRSARYCKEAGPFDLADAVEDAYLGRYVKVATVETVNIAEAWEKTTGNGWNSHKVTTLVPASQKRDTQVGDILVREDTGFGRELWIVAGLGFDRVPVSD